MRSGAKNHVVVDEENGDYAVAETLDASRTGRFFR
jgi:hypothetical protein